MWETFRVENNWGNLTYFLGGKEVDNKVGVVADIKWPDGVVECGVYLRAERRSVLVPDMGHNYAVDQRRFVIDFNCHGITVTLPVDNKIYIRNLRGG